MYLAPHSACHNRHQNNTDRTEYALTQSYGENTASLSALRITSIIDFKKNGNPFFRFYRFFSIASNIYPYTTFRFVRLPPACRTPLLFRPDRRLPGRYHNVIRSFNHIQIMLNYNNRIPISGKSSQNFCQLMHIRKMKSCCRLVKNINRLTCASFAQFRSKFNSCASPPESSVDGCPRRI